MSPHLSPVSMAVNFKTRDPFPIKIKNMEIGQSRMTLHAMSGTLIGARLK